VQGRMTMVAHIPPNFRRVITAAAGGNVIEWYDFYIFGSCPSTVDRLTAMARPILLQGGPESSEKPSGVSLESDVVANLV
jgi:hypothetical protein